MSVTPIAGTVIYWSLIAIWSLGIVAGALLLVVAINHLCWRLYVAFHGWPNVFKAMREYSEANKNGGVK